MKKQRIYLMGICGSGVGALAGLLKAQGNEVTGSDANIYPPMSTKLEEWGIPVLEGYRAENLQPHPDLVIVGNVIRATNPEAEYARAAGLPVLSMPEAVAKFGIADRHSIVVAGTHGKTTTTALIAHLLDHAGERPSFLVGGALVDQPDSFRSTDGRFFVIEGDEYDTAYFDKVPKFVHYRPRTAIITSLEFDHADIYDSILTVEAAFARLVELVPPDGHLVIWEGAHRAVRLAKELARCRVSLYGTQRNDATDVWMEDGQTGPEGLRFTVDGEMGRVSDLVVPMWGEHSAQNALAAVTALRAVGVTGDQLARGFRCFAGVKRRLEVLGTPGGVTVVDDFGHHPTAIRLTLEGARQRWPGQRLWAFFEPRSATSRRNIFEEEFCQALSLADVVVVGSHARLAEVPLAERFSPEAVAKTLREGGRKSAAIDNVSDILGYVQGNVREGDVLVVFSNGDFGGLHRQLMEVLGGGDLNH